MEPKDLKEKCIAKLLPRCTSVDNAIEVYEDMSSGIVQAAWHLMNLSTRDDVMTTAIIQAIRDDIVKIVMQNWVDGACTHFPNNSDVAHAIGAVLLLMTNDIKVESEVYERVDFN